MAIKFSKIMPGMTLLDIHSVRAGNTTMRRLGKWPVTIVSVDPQAETAIVHWNGNPPSIWTKAKLERLYTKEPKKYRDQKARGLF